MIRTLARTLREAWQTAPGICAALLGVTLVAGLEPLFDLRLFARLIDALRFLPEGRWQPVISALLLLLAVRLVGYGAQTASTYLFLGLQMRLRVAINRQIMERAAATPLLELETPAFHDRVTRVLRARMLLINSPSMIAPLLRAAISAAAIFGMLASLHWGAVLMILAGSLPTWLIQGRSAATYNAMRQRQAPWLRRVSYLAGLLTGRPYAQEVRLFGLGEYVDKLYTAQIGQITADQLKVTSRQSYLQAAARVSGTLAYVGSLGLLGARALAGALSIGQFGAMIGGLERLQGTVSMMMEILGNLQQNLPAAADVYTFIDEKVAAPASDGPEPDGLSAALPVTFADVTFRYPGAPGDTLRDISFEVAPGEVVAVVGENGAGKSTLVKLLMGLYQPAAGRITAGLSDPAAPQAGALRGQMAGVFQEFQRYALTAGENIGVGNVHAMADPERVQRAAAAAGAHGVLASLPRGYATPLRREFFGGQELSGGQWQKVAIARAYMRSASIMVLDEPTAALDPEAELEVFRQFRELVQGKTAFFISHRLGAARLADRILVLKHGELVEVGHHDQLMAKDGEYAALFRAQAHWYR